MTGVNIGEPGGHKGIARPRGWRSRGGSLSAPCEALMKERFPAQLGAPVDQGLKVDDGDRRPKTAPLPRPPRGYGGRQSLLTVIAAVLDDEPPDGAGS